MRLSTLAPPFVGAAILSAIWAPVVAEPGATLESTHSGVSHPTESGEVASKQLKMRAERILGSSVTRVVPTEESDPQRFLLIEGEKLAQASDKGEARLFLERNRELLNLPIGHELRFESEGGGGYVFRQYVNGIPVLVGGEIKLQVRPNGALFAIINTTIPYTPERTQPRMNDESVEFAAVDAVRNLSEIANLDVLRVESKLFYSLEGRLTWLVDVEIASPDGKSMRYRAQVEDETSAAQAISTLNFLR